MYCVGMYGSVNIFLDSDQMLDKYNNNAVPYNTYVLYIDLHSGHMIGSTNTPFMDFFTSDTKTIKPVDQLKQGSNNY